MKNYFPHTFSFFLIWFLCEAAFHPQLAFTHQRGMQQGQSQQKPKQFRLDIVRANQSETTGRWWSISGGDCNVEMVTYTTGPDEHEQKRPGQIYFSDITVKGPFVKERKALMEWVNGTAKGKRERVDMTLTFQNDAGVDMNTYTLEQCIPISYQPPAVSAGNYDMLEESLTFHVETVQIANPPDRSPTKNVQDQLRSAASRLCDYLKKIDWSSTIQAFKRTLKSGGNRNPSDACLFGGKFQVSIEGHQGYTTSFSGGGVTFRIRLGPLRDYTVSKVNWANIVIEKNAVQGDSKWKEWFESARKNRTEKKGVIIEYLDQQGNASRTFQYMDCYPIRYDVINLDSRSGSASAKEVIELVVGRAKYE